MPSDLRNSLGNGSQLNYENWLKTGNWEISKNFVFTEPRDFQGRFGGQLEFILKQAPALYARYKSLLGGRGINLEQYTNKPMKYKVTIDGNKAKSTNKTINKIKSMSKERTARKALSLDQPVVRSSKKSKKKRG